MCGISGFIDFKKSSDKTILEKMNASIPHRGPDGYDSVLFSGETYTAGFAHRRLAIIDLTTGGNQPMRYKSYTIIFNGEIYNFQEIREELLQLGHTFTSKSDTEVILHAYEQWGTDFVSKFIGMFALAIYDKVRQEILLVRDRAGVKPLYYYWQNGLFLFGSELKTFHAHPSFRKKVNIQAVRAYMTFGYVPSPLCIFENAYKLDAGHYLLLSLKDQSIKISKYWDVKDYYRLPKLDISYEEARKQLHEILVSAYTYRMVSDVPVGVFLSGGYDSSSVAAILQKSLGGTNRLRTFTIGFHKGNNEAPSAKVIADYLGTDHTEYYCTTKEALDIIPSLPFYYDEPFSDSSAIPTILLSQLARKHVTVALSADGGDEIFAGYSIYNTFERRLSQLQKVPRVLRSATSLFTRLVSDMFPLRFENTKHKLDVVSRVFRNEFHNIPQSLLREYFMISADIKSKLFRHESDAFISEYSADFTGFSDAVSMAQAIDYRMYMQDDILTKVDRATMSASLEGREPLLDQRIIEFAARLPTAYKFGSTQKMILKDIVHEYIPKHIMDRPKTGFSIPLQNWLKNDLKDLADDYLSSSELQKSGVFNEEYVLLRKNAFYNNRFNDAGFIWKLIQFQMWNRQWMG